MFLKNYLKKILARLAPSILGANNINIEKGFTIHKYVEMKGATLWGKINIDKGSKVINGVKISAKSPVNIGRYTSLNGPGMEINSRINSVEIGSFCSIARGVSIQEYNHQYNRLSTYYIFKNIFNEDEIMDIDSKGGIKIGNDVWIGANATIVSGVEIGHGAVIAANSVITQSVPDYAIVGGNPAKVLKWRFDKEIIKELLKVKWWDWSLGKIKSNKELFESPLTLEKLKRV